MRGNGCTGCPIRCHTILKVPSVAAKYGIREVAQNTCAGMIFGRSFFKHLSGGPKGQAALEACMVGMHMADDLGVWCNYGQLQRDFIKLYYDGTLKAKIGSEEYASIPWDKYENGDPAFLFEIIPRIAMRQGELGQALGLGTGGLLARWSIPEEAWTQDSATAYWKFGHPKHHANEDDGQCGVIINTQYNRDAQCHSHVNFVRNGLPLAVQKKLAAEIWGSPDAVDAAGDYTPMNIHKARRARWSLVRKELHDSLGLCNWMGPWVASPLKERGYSGDDSLESRFYSLATGQQMSREELDRIGERIFVLHRALTIRDMGDMDMRTRHDLAPQWIYQDPNGAQPFTKGTIRMDPQDIAKAMDMFYEVMGWDKATGAPTAEGLRPVGASIRSRGPGGEKTGAGGQGMTGQESETLCQALAEAIREASRAGQLVGKDACWLNFGDRSLLGADEPDVPDMEALLAETLAANPDLAALTSISGETLYHAPPLLSRTYAAILDRKASPVRPHRRRGPEELGGIPPARCPWNFSSNPPSTSLPNRSKPASRPWPPAPNSRTSPLPPPPPERSISSPAATWSALTPLFSPNAPIPGFC